MKKYMILALALALLMLTAAAEEQPCTVIGSPEELARISENPDGYYRLDRDIDMTGIDWKPIPFSGTLDGNGYAILNLKVTAPGETRFPSRDGNEKTYDTVGAGLFDCCVNATVRNLKLLGVHVDVTTDENCFCGALMGAGDNVTVENCEIDGRISLTQTGKICGASGLIGYARCKVTGTSVRADVILTDQNTQQNCEEFGSGILACGFADVLNCEINVDLYASVHGYCHNGGLIGMQLRHGYQHRREFSGNRLRFRITFFEHVKSRRAYADALVGELLGENIIRRNNKISYYKVRETKDYSHNLVPCDCNAEFIRELVQPQKTACGFTRNTCPVCGYTYKDAFMPRESGE